MYRSFLAILLICAAVVFVRAEDTPGMLSRADQAFAAADYTTALAMYRILENQITDQSKLAMMRERMRFAERQLAFMKEKGIDPTTRPASADPTTRPTDAAHRVKHAKPADGETLTITLHELGNFEFAEDNDSSIPEDVRALSGSTVKIEGQMLPLDQAGRVTRFILVNDLMSCCYGTAPKLQNIAYVKLPGDKWVEPTVERIAIEGTLKVNVRRDDGFVMSIFEIEPKSIKYAAQ